jgi:trimeric autotransporter adhesin
MNRVWGKAVGIAGLILMLGGTPSWGGPPNNDVSDALGNTAGGSGALVNNTTGVFNTADGFGALVSNTTGSVNTAVGLDVLLSNTTGNNNTGTGAFALFRSATGNNNTASGGNALVSNTSGNNNTASGGNALYNNFFGGFNTASGVNALVNNTLGNNNTASGGNALYSNRSGAVNTASGFNALVRNLDGNNNTAIGAFADVSAGNLSNATAIGSFAIVNASNKIRLGDTAVTVIEGQVAFTNVSDKTKKENFRPVDGEEVLAKIRGFALTSWNFIGHDPKAFRHYGPMAQDFFAAFGHDGVGQIGSETTINAGDMAGILMIAVQALEKRTAELQQKEAQMAMLASQVEDLQAKLVSFETVVARLEALEERMNHAIQITAEQSPSFLLQGK